MMSALLKFILLSCGWFTVFAGYSFYRYVDMVFCVEIKRSPYFTGGMLPSVVSKLNIYSFQGNRMPCLVRSQATISDPV